MSKLSDHSITSCYPKFAPGLRGCRDRELVRYVGRFGVVSIEHVMVSLAIGRTAAYRRVASCIDQGLLERLDLLRAEPSLLRCTRSGLRFAGLGLSVPAVSPGAVGHWLQCATTAHLLTEEFGAGAILTERDLILAECIEGKPIAAAKCGQRPDGAPRWHRPDLAVMAGNRLIAVEIELTPKAPRRLEMILRGWRRAGGVDEVRYYCAPGSTRRAVERAVQRTCTEERVRILEVRGR